MGVLYTNNYVSALSSGITDSQASFDVDSVAGLPSLGATDHCYLTITDTGVEVIKVTNISGSTLTVVRGQDGTSGLAASPGSEIELRLCRAVLLDALLDAHNDVFWKDPVLCATTANITLSGEQTLDGILTSTSRILVKDQTSADENGIYVTAAGAWARSTDADVWDEIPSMAVAVQQGTVNADNMYLCSADSGGTLETTSINFINFGATGPTGAGVLVFSPASDTPGVNDDDAGTDGNGIFAEGSVWVNKATDIIYQCTDASTGAAIWVKMAPINKVIALAAAL